MTPRYSQRPDWRRQRDGRPAPPPVNVRAVPIRCPRCGSYLAISATQGNRLVAIHCQVCGHAYR